MNRLRQLMHWLHYSSPRQVPRVQLSRFRVSTAATAPQAVMLVLLAVLAPSGAAQIPVLLYGRVQDAASNAPIERVLVISEDASGAVLTDSQGNFAIELQGAGPYVLHAVHARYEPTTFELSASARSEISVLLIEPAVTAASLLEPGDRIRLAAEEATGEFRVAAVLSDRLVLDSNAGPAALEVPAASLAGLEIHRGRQISTLKGVFGGAVAGGLLGGVAGAQCLQTHYPCLTGLSVASGVLIGVGLGAVVGLAVSRSSGEVWEQVSLPPSWSLGSSGLVDRDDVSPSVADVESEPPDVVEVIVRNRTVAPMTVFSWWEDGGRVALGDIGGRATRRFVADRRGPAVALFVVLLSDSGLRQLPTRPRRSDFVRVQSGDRIEWIVLRNTSGVVRNHVRLPGR